MKLTPEQKRVAEEIEQDMIDDGMTPRLASLFARKLVLLIAEENAFEECLKTLSAQQGNGEDYGYQHA